VPGSKNLSIVLQTTDCVFHDFISRCFIWDASKRITAEEAIEHEWLKDAFKKIRK
jgi:serine/threonine protein kinase